jgi:hypothetical protein
MDWWSGNRASRTLDNSRSLVMMQKQHGGSCNPRRKTQGRSGRPKHQVGHPTDLAVPEHVAPGSTVGRGILHKRGGLNSAIPHRDGIEVWPLQPWSAPKGQRCRVDHARPARDLRIRDNWIVVRWMIDDPGTPRWHDDQIWRRRAFEPVTPCPVADRNPPTLVAHRSGRGPEPTRT